VHQLAQADNRVVRDDPAIEQDHHVAGDLLDAFEDVRAVDHDLPLRGERLNQAAQDERGGDVEPRVRLVEHDDRRIVQ